MCSQESLDNCCATPLERFCTEEVAEVHQLQNQYLAQREQNETIISRYLQSDLANFGRGSTQNHLDMRAHEVVQQTKRFESVRYDFVRKINEVEARKSFEVAECCVAGILSLKTYYHSCMDRLQSSKNFIEEMRSQQQRDRAAFAVSMRPLDRKKHDINAVLDAMVERVEMASVFLQTDMNTADPATTSSIDAAVNGVTGVIMDYAGGHTATTPASSEGVGPTNTLSRIGAFMGGFGTSSSKANNNAGKKTPTEDSIGNSQVTALCEECEARMKALDHSELLPFFSIRPDEQPAGAVKQGFLWRRVSRKVMDTWERRWFILDDSKLYFISEQDQSYRINVICELMLANIRELKSYEVPFCFEIAFANFKTTIVQAEGIKEYALWIQALRGGIEKSLVSGIPGTTPGKGIPEGVADGPGYDGGTVSLGVSTASKRALMRPVIDRILVMNPFCAECDRPNPDWVSINIGCLVCIDCSGVHRSMGVHISKMRSLSLDDMEPAEYAMLLHLGNTLTNSIWEKELPARGAEKPTQQSSYGVRDVFIRAKYQYKAFLSNPPVCVVDSPDLKLSPPPSTVELWDRSLATNKLCSAVANNEMYEILRAVAADADVSGGLSLSTDDRLKDGVVSPLVVAIRNGGLESALFLMMNGASITQEASCSDSSTPLSLAELLIPGYDQSNREAVTEFEEGGTKAICCYIINKSESIARNGGKSSSPQRVRTSSEGKWRDRLDSDEYTNKGDQKHTGNSGGSFASKAKQFLKPSSSPVFDNTENSLTSRSTTRYRGASDFGELPSSGSHSSRIRSSSNVDVFSDDTSQRDSSSSSINDSSSAKKGAHVSGSSKISQKMRSAFSSTDFLFPQHSGGAADKTKCVTAPKSEEVFHQPFLNRNQATTDTNNVYVADESSTTNNISNSSNESMEH